MDSNGRDGFGAGRGQRDWQALRPIAALLLISLFAAFEASIALATGRPTTLSGAKASFESTTLTHVEKAALATAKRHHGLPSGVPVPAWALQPGRHAYFAPSPTVLRAHQHESPAKAEPNGEVIEGPGGNHSPQGPSHGESGNLGSRFGLAPPLRYFGGVVQHKPVVHLIFWGSNWEVSPGSALRTQLLKMYEGLAKSAYQGILTQYFDSTGHISSSLTVDSIVDSRVAAPKEVNQAALETEVAYAEGKVGKANLESQYAILTAPGSSFESSFTGGYCAFHDVASNGAIFSFLPYGGDEPFANREGCLWYGNGNAADATSVVASHEYAESVTDPLWDTSPGWKSLEGAVGEISDLCATPEDKLPNGSIVQGQYDDHQNSCSLADEAPPDVLGLSETATNLTAKSATLNATINPEGLATSYYFEYGTSKSYGSKVPTSEVSVGSTQANIPVSQAIAGLQIETVYHYRVVATNSSGTTFGEDRTVIPSHWRIRALPQDSKYGWLQGVSCGSERSCMAVGYYYDPAISPEPNQMLAYQLSNGSWIQKSVPPVEGESFPELTSVSCPEENECQAVGVAVVSGHYRAAPATWNGSSWSRQSITPPAGTMASFLYGISCAPGGDCVAVGTRETTSETWVNYAVQLHGGTWSTMETPTAGAAVVSEIRDVSCVSPTSCTAVGWYNPSSGPSKPFSLLLKNGTWILQERAWQGFLEGVSCISSTFCMSVGTNYASGPSGETWNGSEWTPLSTASLPDVQGGFLADVSCAGPSNCTAVGDGYSSINGIGVTLSENWNGTTWTEQTTPRETEVARNDLVDVSCSGMARCVATGLTKARGNFAGLLESRENDVAPTVKSTFGTEGAGNGQLNHPNDMAVDASGNIWVADTENNRIEEFNEKGEYVFKFGSKGSANGQFVNPRGIAVTAAGNLLVSDSGNGRVEEFKPNGEYLSKFEGGGILGKFVEPWGIGVASNGHIWVADARYYRIEEFTSTGEYLREVHGAGWGGTGDGEFAYPTGLAVDSNDNVWVDDTTNNRVEEIAPSGAFIRKLGTYGNGDGQFNLPYGIAVKPSGNVLVVDTWNSRVQEFTPGGDYLTQFGKAGTESEQFWFPDGITVGPGGTEYVADTGMSRIKRWGQPWTPEAVTQGASNLKSEEASLNGTINPSGGSTTYRFEYGTTTSYGTSAPVSGESVGSGLGTLAKTQTISGLSPETTYHFRIVASSSEGTTYGKDRSFTTAPGTAGRLKGMAVTDPFNGSTSAVSDFGANWSALGWASGTPAKGEDTASGWRPVAPFATVNGAFYSPTVTDTGPGIAAVATMAATPAVVERYFSIWLDMPTPSSTRAGYELRFIDTATNTYEVKLSKWVGGTQTVLASKSGYSFSNGNSFAVVDQGSTVSAWTDTGSGFSQLLSVSDSTFSSGNSAVEGAGNITRLTNFKVGQLQTPVSNMDAALKGVALNEEFATNESPLSGGGAWAALNWDNSGTGHNTGRVEGGWGPYDAYSAINGAYWTKSSFADTGAGDAVSALLYAKPNGTNRYFSLWLNMPTPTSAHTGYELRFTETSSGVYEVALLKWQAGTKTSLATKTSYSFATGSQFALVDKMGTVSAWTKTGSEYTQLISASDPTFTSGYTGVEGSGNITRLKEFKSGPLAPF